MIHRRHVANGMLFDPFLPRNTIPRRGYANSFSRGLRCPGRSAVERTIAGSYVCKRDLSTRLVTHSLHFNRFQPCRPSPPLLSIEQRRYGSTIVPKEIKKLPEVAALKHVAVRLRGLNMEFKDKVAKKKLKESPIPDWVMKERLRVKSEIRELQKEVIDIHETFAKRVQGDQARVEMISKIDEKTLDFRENWNVLNGMGIRKEMGVISKHDVLAIGVLFQEAREIASAFLNLIETAEDSNEARLKTWERWRHFITVMTRSMEPSSWTALIDKIEEASKQENDELKSILTSSMEPEPSMPSNETTEEASKGENDGLESSSPSSKEHESSTPSNEKQGHFKPFKSQNDIWEDLRHRFTKLLGGMFKHDEYDRLWKADKAIWEKVYGVSSKRRSVAEQKGVILKRLKEVEPCADAQEIEQRAREFKGTMSLTEMVSLELDFREMHQRRNLSKLAASAGQAIDDYMTVQAVNEAKQQWFPGATSEEESLSWDEFKKHVGSGRKARTLLKEKFLEHKKGIEAGDAEYISQNLIKLNRTCLYRPYRGYGESVHWRRFLNENPAHMPPDEEVFASRRKWEAEVIEAKKKEKEEGKPWTTYMDSGKKVEAEGSEGTEPLPAQVSGNQDRRKPDEKPKVTYQAYLPPLDKSTAALESDFKWEEWEEVPSALDKRPAGPKGKIKGSKKVKARESETTRKKETTKKKAPTMQQRIEKKRKADPRWGRKALKTEMMFPPP